MDAPARFRAFTLLREAGWRPAIVEADDIGMYGLELPAGEALWVRVVPAN